MKHIKKFLSLLLVLTMVLAMSSGVFAKEATSGTVKVSITYNMFTKGGLDAEGKPADQAYKGGTPTMANVNANYYILNYEMSIEDIQELFVDSGVRDAVYNPLLVSKPMCWMLLLRHSTTMILMIFRVVGIPILRRLALPVAIFIMYRGRTLRPMIRARRL